MDDFQTFYFFCIRTHSTTRIFKRGNTYLQHKVWMGQFFELFMSFNHKSKAKINRMVTSLNYCIFQRLSYDFLNLYGFIFILKSF